MFFKVYCFIHDETVRGYLDRGDERQVYEAARDEALARGAGSNEAREIAQGVALRVARNVHPDRRLTPADIY